MIAVTWEASSAPNLTQLFRCKNLIQDARWEPTKYAAGKKYPSSCENDVWCNNEKMLDLTRSGCVVEEPHAAINAEM